MRLYPMIFAHPALRDAPPVLVDVGASGELHPAWQRMARYAVGVGFEPDARDAPAVAAAFRRWVTVPKIVVGEAGRTTADLVLTKFPYCSSTLTPNQAALADWAFAPLFTVDPRQSLPATTLAKALEAHGIAHLD